MRVPQRGADRSWRADARLFASVFLATARGLTRLPSSGWGWASAGSVGLAITLAYVWKRPIAAIFEGHGDMFAADVANVGGSGATVTAVALTVLLVGRQLRRDALVEAALVFGAAGAWCWLLTTFGQLVLAEQRPTEGGELRMFGLGGHGVSGHAAAAALLFAPVRDVLSRGVPRWARHVAGAAVVAWAAFVGWSRMMLGMHFLWNVMLGFAIGFLTGRAGVAAWRDVLTRRELSRSPRRTGPSA